MQTLVLRGTSEEVETQILEFLKDHPEMKIVRGDMVHWIPEVGPPKGDILRVDSPNGGQDETTLYFQ